MRRKAMTEKILVLGVDGMDPRLTRKYVDMGIMPNVQKYLNRGAARQDLVLLGGMPTITPPMWTTLATGANPGTHGITCFWSQHPTKIDTFVYANDSRNCKAEPIWNVFAEAGKKTLVWHWPGSSWPPTSENKNLHVVEGTQPSAVNYGIGLVDSQHIFDVRENYVPHVESEDGIRMNGAGCVVDGMEVEEEDTVDVMACLNVPEPQPISMNAYEGECEQMLHPEPKITGELLQPAKNWINAPEDAKEFSIMLCDGKERRVGLFMKNEQGQYDTVALYTSKKSEKPLIVLKNGEYVEAMEDVLLDTKDVKTETTRSLILENCDPEGSGFMLWMGGAQKKDCDTLFWPKHLYKDVVEHAGYVPSVELQGRLGIRPDLVEKFMHRSWRAYGDWQARAMNYLIKQEGYEVVMSHFHNIDNFGHIYFEYLNGFGNLEHEDVYEKLNQLLYADTDRYLGDFIHLLDEGWTVIITSDHGLICKEDEGVPPALGDGFVVNTGIMRELGYTVMKRNEKGEELREIDYSKTKAVAARGNHIYINLKERYEYGIVEMAEQYELERQIIDDLYNYRDAVSGKRVISLALRNKDAVLLGLNGPDCGDILYWLDESCTRVHGDSLSTFIGHADTSVSPIFIASGAGIKQGFYTDRVIREVDVAPTLAALGGVRMPAQCEGAPAYQIFAEEF